VRLAGAGAALVDNVFGRASAPLASDGSVELPGHDPTIQIWRPALTAPAVAERHGYSDG